MNNLYLWCSKVGDKLFLWGSILMAMLLPIHKMSTSIAFSLMLIGFLLGQKNLKNISKTNWMIFISICFYFLLHIVSYYFSFNKYYAFDDLIIKAPLLLIPLVFLFKSRLSQTEKKTILSTFIFSNLAMGFIIVSRFIIHFLMYGEVILMDELISFTIIHPSYLSFYMILSLFMLLESKETIGFLQEKSVKLAGAIITASSLFLLGSRMAIIVLSLILGGIIIKHLGKLKGSILVSILLLGTILITINTPFLNERFSKAINMFTHSALDVNEYIVDDRLMTWTNSLELIKEEPITGYNIGDYRFSILSEKHNVSGFGKGYRQKLNAHNQLFENWLALGIIGLLSVLSIYLFAGYSSIKNHELIFGKFLVISFMFSMVESIFQSQGGVMFFGFFMAFFMHFSNQELIQKKEKMED